MKKSYIQPNMTQTAIGLEYIVALSGGEQTSIGVNTPNKEVDASNALVKGGNDYNVWDDDWSQ